MKKHIGILKGENEVREALRTKDLYTPYLAYVTDYNQVMYNPWNYIDAYIDWNIRDSISVAYNDGSSHYFSFNCYTDFWYEVENASQAISFSDIQTTGYTSNYGCYFTVGENQGDDRALTFTIAFREEENGPVVYRLTYTINQGANTSTVIGWYVDGAVTTENIQIPQSGGTAQIKIKNASDWSIVDPEYQIIYSGTTDDVVTVSVAANETYNTQSLNYMVFWQSRDGDGTMTLTAVQEGLELPSVTLDNYAHHQETYTNAYFLENTSTAVTVNFSNLSAGNIWEIADENDNILASGTTSTSYDFPVVNNTGVTPVGAFEYNGAQSSRLLCYVWEDDTKQNPLVAKSFTVFKLPSNACLFSLNQPSATGAVSVIYAGGTIPVLVYNYDGKLLLSETFTSTSTAFTNTWGVYGTSEIGIGWTFEVGAEPNMADEQIPVTLEVTVGVDDQGTDDDTYTLDFLQDAYVAPSIFVSYQTKSYDNGLHLIRYNPSRARVSVANTIPGDVILFSTNGVDWSEYPNNRYEVSPISPNSGPCPIMQIPELHVKVQRNGTDVFTDSVMVAQDTSNRPWIGWDGDLANEIYLPDGAGEGGVYNFVREPGNYTFVSVSATGHGFSAYTDDESGEIVLETQYNDTGVQIDGSITAIFEDGEQNQVLYTVTVHQPTPQGA